jgi:hypothetical protein
MKEEDSNARSLRPHPQAMTMLQKQQEELNKTPNTKADNNLP